MSSDVCTFTLHRRAVVTIVTMGLAALSMQSCARSPETFRVGDLQPQDQQLLQKQIYLGQQTLVRRPMPYGVQDGNAIILYPQGDWRLTYRYDEATQRDPQRLLSIDEYVANHGTGTAQTQSAPAPLNPDREVSRYELVGLVTPYTPQPAGKIVVPVAHEDGTPAGEILLERDAVLPSVIAPSAPATKPTSEPSEPAPAPASAEVPATPASGAR